MAMELPEFKQSLHTLIDQQAFGATAEVLRKIEQSSYAYDKATLANIRSQVVQPLTQLAPDNFLVGLRAFVDSLLIN